MHDPLYHDDKICKNKGIQTFIFLFMNFNNIYSTFYLNLYNIRYKLSTQIYVLEANIIIYYLYYFLPPYTVWLINCLTCRYKNVCRMNLLQIHITV